MARGRFRHCPNGHNKDAVGRTPRGECKACILLRAKAWKDAHPEQTLAHGRKWARRHIRNVPPEPAPGTPCEVCRAPMARIYCDHDHQTGEFRGWLCNRCNTRLGGIDDSVWHERALKYLKERK